MDFVFDYQILWKIFLGICLGGFLGIRREIVAQQQKKPMTFMGLRTMILLCVLGVLSTFFSLYPYLPVVFFGGILVFLWIAYVYGAFRLDHIGLTSEISAFFVFWIGVLIGFGENFLAILFTLFIAVTNSFKQELHNFVKTLTQKEWRAALQFLFFFGAVLPILPRTAIDPWGILVPFNIWLVVILISGIGFFGYFFTKYFGAKGGIPLIGFLGALASSTAVTVSLATESKKILRFSPIFLVGILIALGTMHLRVFLEMWVMGREFLSTTIFALPLTMALFSFSIASIYFVRNYDVIVGQTSQLQKTSENLSSPFDIFPALKFGGIFVLILVVLALAQHYLGNGGVYLAAFLSGLIDIDAIILSSLESARSGDLSVRVVENSIFIAIMMNTLVKAVFVFFMGNRVLAKRIFYACVIICGAGGALFLL